MAAQKLILLIAFKGARLRKRYCKISLLSLEKITSLHYGLHLGSVLFFTKLLGGKSQQTL